MIFWILWSAALTAIVYPDIDIYLDSVMYRHLLIQIPSLILLGYLGGKRFLKGSAPTGIERELNARGFSGLIFFTGVLIFWMLPLSIDSTVSSDLRDNLMHICMLFAGIFLASSERTAPPVLKSAYEIYFTAMIIAMGNIYAVYSELICASYTLEQQHQTGYFLLYLSPVLFFAVFIRSFRRMRHSGGSHESH